MKLWLAFVPSIFLFMSILFAYATPFIWAFKNFPPLPQPLANLSPQKSHLYYGWMVSLEWKKFSTKFLLCHETLWSLDLREPIKPWIVIVEKSVVFSITATIWSNFSIKLLKNIYLQFVELYVNETSYDSPNERVY